MQHLKEVTETYSQKDSHLNVVVVNGAEEYKVIVVGMVGRTEIPFTPSKHVLGKCQNDP